MQTTQKWQIQEAKSKFSQVIDSAISQGAQYVTRRGHKVAVILSVEDYESMKNANNNLLDTLLNAPKGEALIIDRPDEIIRDIEL